MLRDPEIKAQVEELRHEALGAASGKLAGATTEAAEALVGLLSSKSEMVRLSAAKAILESAVRMRELVELESRLEALERLEANRNRTEGVGP